MNRGQQSGTHDEGTEKRQREGQYCQQDRPAFERVTLLCHDGRVQERGPEEPGHERHILDRVPEPPAAPSKLVIGPPGPKGDPRRQADPGGKCPGTNPACPGRINPALDQRCNGERKHNREPDIPEIEKGGMHRQANILKQWIQILSVQRWWKHAVKRIRSEKHEGQKTDGDPGLNRKRARLQRCGYICAHNRNARAKNDKYQCPEQQ